MQKQSETSRNVFIAILILILGGVIGYRIGSGRTPSLWGPNSLVSSLSRVTNTSQPTEFKDIDFNTFWEVWKLLERDYVEPEKLDNQKMVNGAISGMTAAVGDPYTIYLPPQENQRSGEDLAGAFYGIGVELAYVDNTLAVVAPVTGSPAEKAGIKAEDLILHVKDEAKNLDSDTTGWSLSEAVNHIRGEKGTNVTLTLLRKQEKAEPFTVTLQRGEIIVPSVELTFKEHAGKRVAHLKLSRFGERTQGEWEQAVTEILAQKNQIKGIVLDMRNNPGGFFEESIDIASEFIESGVVVSQQGRYRNEAYNARGDARLADIPVEVLVNRGSASASEIVAGALRDQKGAKLIGERTFGKGTVQDRRVLSNGAGIHITIGKWLLPKGSWIHEEGIPVDVEAPDKPETEEDEGLLKAIEVI